MKRIFVFAMALLFASSAFTSISAAPMAKKVSVPAVSVSAKLVAKIRRATAKYLDVKKAEANGYIRVSGMAPNMGYHFRNSKIRGFDVEKPNLLLYIKQDGKFVLAGVEWGWPKGKQPKSVPFPNTQWKDHEAACHYKDGSEAHSASPKSCPKKNPKTGAPFAAWHPTLATVHVWAWYPNPDGVFRAHNHMLAPFNK